jgi:hypothetical protein
VVGCITGTAGPAGETGGNRLLIARLADLLDIARDDDLLRAGTD